MKYFTPELYVQGNSSDEQLVTQTEAAWDLAISRYQRHYRKIRRQLPESVRKFHDECCLHDAAVFGPARLSMQSVPWNFTDVVLVVDNQFAAAAQHQRTLMFLQYAVTDEPLIDLPVVADCFGGSLASWLYDELDVTAPGVFSHEILLSDGRVISLRFREFHLQIAPLFTTYRDLNVKKIQQEKAASA